MPDYAKLARNLVAATLARAVAAINRELNAKPMRQAVSYHGVRVNTRERYLRLKAKR